MTSEASPGTRTPAATADRLERLAELYALLSRVFAFPDDDVVEALDDGRYEAALRDRAEALGVEVESPPRAGSPGELREEYLRSFEAYEGAFAPPVESVYEPWWDGTERELLSGPTAVDMRRRYEAIDADLPSGYPPDHVALLLEYGSLLLEAGEREAYERFHEAHFDWIPSFRRRVERTSESAFYRWAVASLDRVTGAADGAVCGRE
ncbi:TorD/DmsD family molecular chaperone [Salinilacihabitans rarus]|uniref:TorD/DmsD family molecular chaperone n=1 Tax=Salinilacihabitans rarus TaxID=2961596 RepID=UPI0020C8C436|nr:molecular chaperone TorD family protein [Salinilacihabitans rarus]